MSIKITFTGNKKIDAYQDSFVVHSDQKKEDGGNESAPTPFNYFLISIALCAGHYINEFCNKRNISTDGITLIQKTVHDNEKKRIAKLITEIHLPETFPEKYKSAVINAANTCAVKKYIENPFEFETISVTDK